MRLAIPKPKEWYSLALAVVFLGLGLGGLWTHISGSYLMLVASALWLYRTYRP